jgi:hypothetical protein
MYSAASFLLVWCFPSMSLADQTSFQQAKLIADELATLSKQQSLALQGSAYGKMSTEEAERYDQRRIRIGELCTLLNQFKPKD